MSAGPYHDMALLIAARLEAWPALADVPVVVDMQKDIVSEVAAAVEKERGLCITITYEGNRKMEAKGYRKATYAVRCYGLPIVADGETILHAETADAEVTLALDEWVPETNHNFNEAIHTGSDMVADPAFLIYEGTVEVPVYLETITA